MRRPSTEAEMFSWWRATLDGLRPDRVEDEPHPGFYKRRFVKDGPWCPVRIWREQVIDPETGELAEPEYLRCEMLGEARDPVAMWPYCRAISREDYDALVEHHRRLALMAATHARIDLSETPIRPRRYA